MLMKRFFSLMLAFACALFVGVSCTPDTPDTPGGGGEDVDLSGIVALTFNETEVANLAPSKGKYNLHYTVDVNTTIYSQIVLGKPSAKWLTVELSPDGDDYLVVKVESNPNNPGSAPRKATFTAQLDKYDPITVTVTQDSHESVFDIEWLNVSCNSAECYCVPKDNDLKYIVVSSSQLADLKVEGNTVVEQLTAYVEKLGKEGSLEQAGQGYWFQGSSIDFPAFAGRVDSASTGEVYAVGFDAAPNGETETDEEGNILNLYTAQLTTAVHTWAVPFTPFPEFAATTTAHEVDYQEGVIEVDCKVDFPMINGEVSFLTDANWLTPSWSNDKLTLSYVKNSSAIARSTKLTIKYGLYKVFLEGTDKEYRVFDTYAETTFHITQKKDPEAEAPTYTLTLKDNQFHKFVVDIATNDEYVHYVVDHTISTNVTETNSLSAIAQRKVEEAHKWGHKSDLYKLTTYQGNTDNFTVKLNVNNYEAAANKDFYIFVYPVDLVSMSVLADPTAILVTVDDSVRPSLQWVEANGLTLNKDKGVYEIEAKAGDVVTLKYALTNPVEEGVVDILNRAYIKDMKIIADNAVVIDQEACTVTFTVRADYDQCTSHAFDFSLTYKDKDDNNWIWSTYSDDVKIYQVQ